MNEEKSYYLVMAMTDWLEIQASNTRNLKVAKYFGVGFAPVFDSEEEARKSYPDAEIVEIRKAGLIEIQEMNK